jgi:thioredoxin 1
MQGPIIDELAKEYKDKAVKIAKLNVDDNQDIAGKYNVFSIPTLAIFLKGELKERITGLHQKEALKEKIDQYIK